MEGDSKSQPIVSFCIGTYNRCACVIGHVREMLESPDEDFDIIVLDNASTDDTWEQLKNIADPRLHCYRNERTVDYMTDWYLAMEKADGYFAFYLNDRDRINMQKLDGFLRFLKEHKEFNGGVCKYICGASGPMEYRSIEDAVMNVPYFALHPTGHVFCVDSYKKIKDRRELFTRRLCGEHPHDMILGRLSAKGNIFVYTEQIWFMASKEFYKKNPSWIANKSRTFWFEPHERIKEMICALNELEKLPVEEAVRRMKKTQMIKTYLQLCTVSYFYVLEDEAEAAHYQIPCRKISIWEKRRQIKKVLQQFDDIAMLKPEFSYRKMKKWTNRNFIIHEAARRTARYKNSFLRKMLGNIRRRNADKAHISLR